MIAGTASMGFRSEEITRDRERREEKASEKAPAPAPNTPTGDGSGTPVADGVPLEAPPVPLRRMSTFARMSKSMSKIKAPIPKFFRKGVVAVSSDAAGEIVARMAQDQPVSFRERLFLVMTEPSTGRVAKLVATFSWLVVLADGAKRPFHWPRRRSRSRAGDAKSPRATEISPFQRRFPSMRVPQTLHGIAFLLLNHWKPPANKISSLL